MRETVFNDKTRSAVLLIDKIGVPVIVECKQGAPTLENIKQLENYMAHNEVKLAMKSKPLLKIVRYSLHVDFGPCA